MLQTTLAARLSDGPTLAVATGSYDLAVVLSWYRAVGSVPGPWRDLVRQQPIRRRCQ